MAKAKVQETTEEPVKRNLSSALQAINKKFGEGSIRSLGDKANTVEAVPTGVLPLDVALGIGGLPRGRIVEIFGPEASGKSTLTQAIAAQVQRDGGLVAIVDAEHALDPKYASAIGVNIKDLLFSQPDSGEQALDIVEQLVLSGEVDLIIVDSVANLVPQVELDGEMTDQQMGAQARLMGKALRKLTGIVSKNRCIVIFINQIRQKIGVMYGNPETTPGGNALKFYASIRIDIRKIESLTKDKAQIGNRVKAKVIKNKVAPPFKEAEFDILFGKGIDAVGALVYTAAELKVLEKAGSYYRYNDKNLGQGFPATCEHLKENPELYSEIDARVRLIVQDM